MNRPEPYEHFRPEESDVPDGIYRVVGRDDRTVTLLRVADADERRAHTGETVTVTLEEFDGFGPAENPDGDRPYEGVLVSNLEMRYWSARAFVQQLAVNPRLSAVALTLVFAGVFGDRVLSLPDFVFSGLILLGSLSLAYIGGGRLS